MIDLHTHSTASDGTLRPEELVELAAERGLSAMALTDHDTVAGVPAALERGEARGVHIIPGVELGIRWEGGGKMHLLGYYVRHQDGSLGERLEWLCERRRERAQRIVKKLNAAGIQISFAQVEEIAGGQFTLQQSSGWPGSTGLTTSERKARAIGRPHVARVLMEAGVVSNMGEAFGRFLSPGRPGYEDKEELGPEEAIKLLKSVGAVAVLAHPRTLKLDAAGLAQCVEELKSYGLDGLEAIWSGHSHEQMSAFKTLAKQMDLVATGGSDFHGENKPDIKLGSGRKNNVQVPDSVLEALRQRRTPPAPSGR